jgi:hypothetical protein
VCLAGILGLPPDSRARDAHRTEPQAIDREVVTDGHSSRGCRPNATARRCPAHVALPRKSCSTHHRSDEYLPTCQPRIDHRPALSIREGFSATNTLDKPGAAELGCSYRSPFVGLDAAEAEALGVILGMPKSALVERGMRAAAHRACDKLVESLPNTVRQPVHESLVAAQGR